MRWTTQAAFDDPAAAREQREIDYLRLLRNVPAIGEIAHLDVSGKEQLRVSRLALDAIGSQEDYSQSPKFIVARAGATYFGPVYFRNESEPYMTIAVPAGEYGTEVTVAEVNLNDPVVVSDPVERAVRMAVAMRGRVEQLREGWRKRDYDLGLGIGIAQGYATIGAIGFEGRRDYGAIGTVTNLAARLCGEAADGQILVSSRVAIAAEGFAEAQEVPSLILKGLSRPVRTFNISGLK